MFRRPLMIVITALLAVVLSACGQATTSSNDSGGMSGMASTMPETGHDMGSAMASTMPATDHSMASDMASSMASSAPYDAQFIDSMIEHHTGAITMAKQALQESQRPEIKQLAQAIIDSQQQEVEQMQRWRTQWYPALAPTGGMSMEMGDMQLSSDTSKPFDQRFIEAMIAHHTGAIEMAKDAQSNAEHAEIKQLAGAIITAQEAEVTQLQQWQKEWFGV